MNSKEETRTVWFRTWIKWLLISLLWRGLELCFYGEARESNEDTIISLVLLWYIWKSEVLKIGALDKTHNPDLAIQTAMGVTMVLRTIDAQNEPKQPAQPQINPMAALFGAMMQQAAQNQQEEGNPEGSEIESDDDE